MNRSGPLIIALLGVALGSCNGSGEAAAGKAEQASTEQASTATGGAWCEEHDVPEAMCTKCNPALIPGFKAKGDWCEEHGFPESVCPICHPERSHHHGAHAREGGDEEHHADEHADKDGPADGTKVQLKDADVARRAGLQLTKVVSGVAERTVEATARIVYDATRVAQVNARVRGVVRTLRADVGTRVRAGSALAVIESADLGADQSHLSAASARSEVAEANYARIQALRSDGISSQRDLLSAQSEREQARAELRAAQGALGMVGASANDSGRYTLTAPIAGVITQRNATIGRLIESAEVVFEIVDPSAMWLELDVPEVDLALVTAGQRVRVALDALPGRELEASLSYVAPAIDPRTRTAVARAALPNPDGALRANLFGRAHIAVSAPQAALWVPRASVQHARNVDLVFVREGDAAFEARRVQLGPADGERVSVTGRLQAGDEVVTEGSFLLKTETLKDSIGAGCCAAD